MRTAGLLVASLIMLATLAPAARAQSAAGAAGPTIIIETSAGEIRVSLDTAHAPATTANFLRYVDQHFYDDTAFYRTVRADNQPDNAVKIEVIQAGVNNRLTEGFEPSDIKRNVIVNDEDRARPVFVGIADVGNYPVKGVGVKVASAHLDDRTEAAIKSTAARGFDYVGLPPECHIAFQDACLAIGRANFAALETAHTAIRVVIKPVAASI